MFRPWTTSAALGVAAVLGAACGQDIAPSDPRNLDRPTAAAFACFGEQVVDRGTPDERTIVTAQPMESCTRPDDDPDNDPKLVDESNIYTFVLQPAKGTMALIRASVFTVLDADPLTPGRNAIPVGSLPIDTVADDSGCWVVTANAGSCDLSGLEVNSAVDPFTVPQVRRLAVINGLGDAVDARPRDIALGPQRGARGLECPASPTGIAYVAYPDCHLVAAVDLATGAIQGGVQFDEGGNASIVGPDVQCASQCGGGNEPTPPVDGGMGGDLDAGVDGGMMEPPPPPPPGVDGGAPRPVTLAFSPDGGELYIGAENSPVLTSVALDGGQLPAALSSVALEGDVGLTRIKISPVIAMGGATGMPGGAGGDFQFAYAIASDRTIRVVDLGSERECDTQVDPRFLYEVRDLAFLACMPVGDPATPPRRAGARSPGIVTPRDSVPLDLEFATLEVAQTVVSPFNMVGTFAYVTTSDGFVLVINVDDDRYPDAESMGDPESTFMPLAIAHQPRDLVSRDGGENNEELDPAAVRRACALADSSELILPPRLRQGIGQQIDESAIALEKLHELPFPRSVECQAIVDGEPGDSTFVTEMALAAPADLREVIFPDLLTVRNEDWSMTWEGAVSRDAPDQVVDGPSIRVGILEGGGGALALRDPAAPFCDMGAEPFDIVALAGCDPTSGNNQCGVGETCFVHPDAPAAVSAGFCLPTDRADALSASCQDFLISRKRYTIRSTDAGRLELGVRRRVLATTPLDGCESAAQCEEMADLGRLLAFGAHPLEADVPPPERDFSWTCEADPTRAPGPSTCQMTCEASEDCEDGFSCQGGFCVEAPLPPAACVTALQRYQVRVGEAFAVVGARSGFLHNRIIDAATGECIDNPAGNPLNVGRLPLEAPACTGDGLTDLSPNPCETTVLQEELFADFVAEDGRCTPRNPNAGLVPRERMAPAVRFSNPAFTFHMVDPYTTGDLECRDDRQGTHPRYSPVHPGYALQIQLTGGFIPMFVPNIDLRFPATITRGPDGRLWVMDQGDINAAIRGQVLTITPEPQGGSFGAQFFL